MRDIFRLAVLGMIIISCAFVSQCAKKDIPVIRPASDQIVMSIGDYKLTAGDMLVAFQEEKSFESILVNKINNNLAPLIIEFGTGAICEHFFAEQARQAGLDKKPEFEKAHNNFVKDELYQKVILNDVIKKIRLSDQELKQYYDENRNSIFLKPNTNVLLIRGIWISYEKRSREEVLELAQQAYASLEKGDPFEIVARKYSEAEIHKRGKPNKVPPGMFDPEIAAQIDPLEDGEYTEVFEFEPKKRFYIMKKIRFIDAEYHPFESVRLNIIKSLASKRQNDGIFLLSQQLQKKHNLLVNSSWIENPDEVQDNAVILAVPDIYELTLGEFKQYAGQQNKWTPKNQKDYLSFLGNKAVCLAEAYSRDWGETDVAKAVEYWDRNKLAKSWINHVMDQKYPITEQQIRNYYDKNKNHPTLHTPALYDLSHLLFSVPVTPGTSIYQTKILYAQAKAQADKAYKAIQNGMKFDEVATQFAEFDKIKAINKRFKYIPLNGFSHKMRDSIVPGKGAPMKIGDISEPERIQNLTKEEYGYEIFYLRNITASKPLSYEEARVVIGQHAANSLSLKVRRELKKEFLSKNPLSLNQQQLQSVIDYLVTLAERPDWQSDISRYEESD